MAIRIVLDDQPEFYTNLDRVAGRVVVALTRAESVASIVVKLEGEAVTALQVPSPYDAAAAAAADARPPGPLPGPPGSVVAETHKLLYKVQQVFPDDYHASASAAYGAFPLLPGEHAFPFAFKLPINNACSDPLAMSRIGGLGGLGGFGSGGGLFGLGGVRVMDGSKQLFLRHVTRTLAPSLTGYPMQAEIRYYIKVTVQRPGLLKENWRLQTGFKFLPIEPPRPPKTGQEVFARRPFSFRPRSPPQQQQQQQQQQPQLDKKRSSFFTWRSEKGPDSAASLSASSPAATAAAAAASPAPSPAPSIEMSARLPHPPVLTCNLPVPLRLIAKKLADCPDKVHLISLQLDLIGITQIRSHNIVTTKMNRWVVVSNSNLHVPLTSSPQDPVGHEMALPDDLWRNKPLPNTIAPSFVTCNLSRRYELELKLGLSWGTSQKGGFAQPQTIFLPLHFAQIDVYSGITPPPELVEAARNTQPGRATLSLPPRLPPRASAASLSGSATRPPQPQDHPPQRPDPLYPPQLAPGQTVPPSDDAPPSYDEAMAENLSGPFDGSHTRPAYSGVTNENAPSQMPEKR